MCRSRRHPRLGPASWSRRRPPQAHKRPRLGLLVFHLHQWIFEICIVIIYWSLHSWLRKKLSTIQRLSTDMTFHGCHHLGSEWWRAGTHEFNNTCSDNDFQCYTVSERYHARSVVCYWTRREDGRLPLDGVHSPVTWRCQQPCLSLQGPTFLWLRPSLQKADGRVE